jgi:uncharacterized protein GlcG (DUF336 family)
VAVSGIDLARARRAVDAGLAWAGERALRMSVVVLDATGTVRASAQMDGARTITYDIAVAKANTAREFRTSTAVLAANVKPENKIALAQLSPRIAFLGGGVPVHENGEVIGAIGVSGGNEAEDVECAEACLAALDDGAGRG